MSPSLTAIRDGKKFLWDGQLYETSEEASRVAQSYREENFQIQIVEEGGKFVVYTRRPVKEVAVTAH
jgi:hypothetical protein